MDLPIFPYIQCIPGGKTLDIQATVHLSSQREGSFPATFAPWHEVPACSRPMSCSVSASGLRRQRLDSRPPVICLCFTGQNKRLHHSKTAWTAAILPCKIRLGPVIARQEPEITPPSSVCQTLPGPDKPVQDRGRRIRNPARMCLSVPAMPRPMTGEPTKGPDTLDLDLTLAGQNHATD